MAVAQVTTLFGDTVLARWVPDSGGLVAYVGVAVNGGPWVFAFTLATEADVQLSADPSGAWWLTYAGSDGTPVRHRSIDHGATWTVV